MSMFFQYKRLPLPHLQRLIQTPVDLFDFWFPDEFNPAEAATELDIGRAWHAIHFLLTDDPWYGTGPLSKVVLGGTPFDCQPGVWGYGPPSFLLPDEVKSVATALRPITPPDLKLKYDARRLNANQIYPHNWTEDREPLNYVLASFKQVKRFFRTAAKVREAVVTVLV